MKKKQIKIGVGNFDQYKSEFIATWKRAEKGLPPKAPIHRLCFETQELLLEELSSRRIGLMWVLRNEGKTSIRALAKILKRDYKNVHTDVKKLTQLDLIKLTKDGKIFVDWDILLFEIPLIKTTTKRSMKRAV